MPTLGYLDPSGNGEPQEYNRNTPAWVLIFPLNSYYSLGVPCSVVLMRVPFIEHLGCSG